MLGILLYLISLHGAFSSELSMVQVGEFGWNLNQGVVIDYLLDEYRALNRYLENHNPLFRPIR